MESLAGIERMELTSDIEAKGEAQDLASLELPLHLIRPIAVAQPQVLFQKLTEWPVRDPVPIREASTGASEWYRLLVGERLPQLTNEPCLSDARLADDRHEMRLGLGGRAPIGRPKQLELGLATHEDAMDAP